MRIRTRILAGALATLALTGLAVAQDLPTQPSEAKVIYEGVDNQGRTVRVTISGDDAKSSAVSARVQEYPQLHWSAYFGSGTAATIAR